MEHGKNYLAPISALFIIDKFVVVRANYSFESEEAAAEFIDNSFAQILAGFSDFGKFIHPFVGPAGVDDRTRIQKNF